MAEPKLYKSKKTANAARKKGQYLKPVKGGYNLKVRKSSKKKTRRKKRKK